MGEQSMVERVKMKRRAFMSAGLAATALPLMPIPAEAAVTDSGPIYAAGQVVGSYRRIGNMVHFAGTITLRPGQTAIIYGLPAALS